MDYAQTFQRPGRVCFWCGTLVALIVLFATTSIAQTPPTNQSPDAQFAQMIAKNPELVAEFGRLAEKLLRDLRYPPGRSASHLMTLLPEETISYAAFSNYGDVSHQALKIFRQELEASSALRDWWHSKDVAKDGPKIEDFLEKVYQLSQYVGDEIVASGAMDGKDFKPLFVAEIRKPGLQVFLQQLVKEHPSALEGIRILDAQDLAGAADRVPKQELVVLVRPDVVIAAIDLATLRRFNARLDKESRGFPATPFGQRIVQGYKGGLTISIAADLQSLLKQIPQDNKQALAVFERSGFADMKFVAWEHKTVAGQDVSQMELSFKGLRHGVASWLTPPKDLGSLEFVSAKSMMAMTLMLKNPTQIFDEAKELATALDPKAFAPLEQMEQTLGIRLKDHVLSQLGGEITLELVNADPPSPQIRLILRANGGGALAQALSTVLTSANLKTNQFEDGGVNFYTVQIPAANPDPEITYAFADGYLIIGSGRKTVTEAIRLHTSGESLGKSKKFLTSLPRGYGSGASALYYMNSTGLTLQGLQRSSPEMARALAQMVGEGEPAVATAYADETAIRQVSTNPSLDVGVTLIVAAIAIPNLLRSRMQANEASAVGSIRSVNTAQVAYGSTYPGRKFARDLATLGPDPNGTGTASANHADLLNTTLANATCTAGKWCTKSGFQFSLTAVCKLQQCGEYVVVSTPVTHGTTGIRSFCSTSDGIIRFNPGPQPTVPISVAECKAWPPIQ